MMCGKKLEYAYSSNVQRFILTLPQNFMKCLMRMFAEEDQGVVFFETVISLKKQKHTCIECVPMPWSQFDLIPGYFKVRIGSFYSFSPGLRIFRNHYCLQRLSGRSTRK